MTFKIPEIDSGRKQIAWLKDRTLFLTNHGSFAYGTNVATSDRDYKGFAVPPKEYVLGYLNRFEQAEFKQDVDMVVYGVQKFFKLAADCNPNIIEVLHTAPEDHHIVTPLGEQVLANRDLFLSTKAKHTFSGYAVAQLKRIKNHRRWIVSPPKAPPSREEAGLPTRAQVPSDQLKAAQAMIRKQIENWNVPVDELDDAAKIAVQERFVESLTLIESGYREQALLALLGTLEGLPAEDLRGSAFSTAIDVIKNLGPVNLERVAASVLGFDTNFLELLDKERHFKTMHDDWNSYQTWLKTRNPARAAMEQKFGFDGKHGLHLVRLMRMGIEILEGRGVIVKRPDAQELLEIRNGLWTYERLVEYAESMEERLATCYRESKLPKTPNTAKIDQLLVQVMEKML